MQSYCASRLEKGIDILVENTNTIQEADAEGSTYDLITKGIHLSYTNQRLLQSKSTLIEYCEPVVQLHFSVRCSSEYRALGQSRPFATFAPCQHNLLILPPFTLDLAWEPHQHLELFSINIAPSLFFNYLPPSHPFYHAFRQHLEDKVPRSLRENGLPITPRISTILYELLHCELGGCYKRLFVEAKIVELLALQLGQYEQLSTLPSWGDLKKEDVEKMHLVRETMLANLDKTFSLKDLAHQAGTNEYNLKSHFKRVFGNTVFGYLHEHRMEQSKKLLSEGEEKVSEVARLMGYKHATHFTVAFKKHFGFLPHKIRAGLGD